MKLAAIYCVWDDWDLLNESVRVMSPLVDGLVIVGTETSNYGEFSPIPQDKWWSNDVYEYEPNTKETPHIQERAKRNFALDIAKELGYTHFIMLDADEFYEPLAFLREKEVMMRNKDLNGMVCGSQVYFRSPELTIGLDTTLVPFIHKLHKDLHFKRNTNYPFAYKKATLVIDPTRQMNLHSGVRWSDITMHHYSYIRKDLKKKIRNSAANLAKSSVLEDYKNAKEGYFCKMYGKALTKCDNLFNLHEIIDESI